MKILKFLPLLLVLSLYTSNSYADVCDDIKMDSSVNIVKKLQCKAGGGTSLEASEGKVEEVDDGSWKLWRKPEWMKKKN